MREWINIVRGLSPGRYRVAVMLAVGFMCALGWAKGRDPFVRQRFSVLRAGAVRTEAVAVLAKPVSSRPVVVYLHDAGANLEGSGPRLRQLAELGVAAVGMEYNQTNQAVFNRQFMALLERIGRESWAQTNALVWLGYGAGAQRMLRFARLHAQPRPQLLVCLAGGQATDLLMPRGRAPLAGNAVASGTDGSRETALSIGVGNWRVALVHGQADEVFPAKECERLGGVLRGQSVPTEVCILEGQGHTFGENEGVVFRLVAEFIVLHSRQGAGQERLRGAPPPHVRRLQRHPPHSLQLSPACGWQRWLWLVPLVAVLATLGRSWWRRVWPSLVVNAPRTWPGKGFTALALCVGLAAFADATLHVVLPRCAVSEPVKGMARRWLVTPEWREGFDFLAADEGWSGRALKQLLEHAELASLQRKQFYANLDVRIYQESVLSPKTGGSGDGEWGWRRTLWETFYPRVRKGNEPVEAARTVVRFLRERVAIRPEGAVANGVETSWRAGVASDPGFEQLYVAALRSVGVAARLGAQGKAELWTGAAWQTAPEPFAREGLVFKQ